MLIEQPQILIDKPKTGESMASLFLKLLEGLPYFEALYAVRSTSEKYEKLENKRLNKILEATMSPMDEK